MFHGKKRSGFAQGATALLLALMALGSWQIGTGGAPAPAALRIAPSGSTALDGPTGPADAAPVPAIGDTSGAAVVGQSYKNDVSPPLRDIPPNPPNPARANHASEDRGELIPLVGHKD